MNFTAKVLALRPVRVVTWSLMVTYFLVSFTDESNASQPGERLSLLEIFTFTVAMGGLAFANIVEILLMTRSSKITSFGWEYHGTLLWIWSMILAAAIISIVSLESPETRRVPSDLVKINGWILVSLSMLYFVAYPVWTRFMFKRIQNRF